MAGVIMIWIGIAIFITCYVLPAIACYGLTLPYVEYIQKTMEFEAQGLLKNAAFHLALLGPIGLWAFIYADETKYCGFKFIRKTKK